MFSPDWPLIPGFCGPSSLAHLTGSRQGETVVWPLIPANLTFFLGEGRTQRPDPSTSPILLPLASLPLASLLLPLPGLAEAKENRALPQLTLSLPHFLLKEDGLLPPPPWLRTWPWCQVSPEFPELEALPGLKLDPSPLSISPYFVSFLA